ncbi:Protein O-mannosyl-transferase tmtc4 [Dermatophagoides pteronyssinus]|uniref:dolichyl-phosphate-mannose--protein mannosyltransferase n=1 Tax=Dermatophagoides pteronyssinus TaxID=6956 RepID=A0ABQ8J105_DERPT|nr:Protein O-mannosyl-transferase tmtc4 [Dermatophagoides pteronyssinus]
MNYFIDYFLIILSALLTFIHLDNIFSIKIFQNDFWGTNIATDSSHKSYRPLTVIIYRLIAKFVAIINHNNKTLLSSQSLDPFPFHCINLLAYCVCCCFTYLTLQNWLKSKLNSCKEFRQLALKITLFFTIHPLHCEPVSTCVGLADILSATSSLISLNYFLSNLDLYDYHTNKSSSSLLKWIRIQLNIILFAFASMLFKEQGITILGFLLILLIQLWLASNNRHQRRLIYTVIIYLVTIIGFLYLRLWLMNFKLPRFGSMDNPSSHITNRLFRLINYNYIYFLNTVITICPIWLSFDWSMGCIRLIETFNDYRFILVILFWITSIIIICRICFTEPNLLPFILFTIITFLPSSNIFFQVGFVIAERNLFLPILGYCTVFVHLHYRLTKLFAQHSSLLNKLFYLLLIFLTIRSYQRSGHWNNELKLYELDSRVCPNNAKIYYNIGKISSDLGNRTKAIDNYRHSLLLYENYTNALNNLANILKQTSSEELLEASKLLQRACQLDPEFATGWMNLATVEMSLGNFQKSEQYFYRALVLRPNHANTHFNMGNLYIKQKRFKEAENSFNRAIELNSKFVKAWHNLILLKQNEKSYDQAYELARKALIELPDDDSLYFLIGNICGQYLQKYQEAEQYFLKAIRLKPENPSYLNNLAVLYHKIQRYSDAIYYYQQTLLVNPGHLNAKDNLNKLLIQQQEQKKTRKII